MKFFEKALYCLSAFLYSSCSLSYSPATLPALHNTLQMTRSAEQPLYEDNHAYALQTSASPISLRIFPKKELAGISELDLDKRSNRDLLAHLVWIAQHLGNQLFSMQSYRLTINSACESAEPACFFIQLEATKLGSHN